MPDLTWLTARPVAHRGLHDLNAGIVENTSSAFAAAVAGGYAVECDVQISADGEAMVHHDDVLGRLTDGSGPLDSFTAEKLRAVSFRATTDRMMSLGELCDLVAGRVTLLIEIKSHFDGDLRLAERAACVLRGYSGPAALMSFDPGPVAHVRSVAPTLVRGIVAEQRYTHREWDSLSNATKRALAYFHHAMRTKPQFIAYSIKDLPSVVTTASKRIFRLPLLTWTVRTEGERNRASRYADQMIFEGFRP